jgi:signal peptidase I
MVDKVTYSFRPPRRGEVFIFKTAGISGLEHERGPDQEGSEDFIKRCVGQAGDVIQVRPPQLFVNGLLAAGAPAFGKEFAQAENYPGYSLVEGSESTGTTSDDGKMQTYYVPVDSYWAMGDNSPHSKDSRYWGGVPRQNLVGRGGFVFWPFTKRWGFIR